MNATGRRKIIGSKYTHIDQLALLLSSLALFPAALSPFPSPSGLSSLVQFGRPAPDTSEENKITALSTDNYLLNT